MQEIIYDIIGRSYNGTRRADPYIVSRLIHLLQPATEKIYLDIGCGTGNYTIALAKKGISLVGVEPSEYMLKEAQSASKNVNWLQGTAEKIPTNENFFDGVIATLTIHHWKRFDSAFKELNRVLKKNAKIVFFTSTPEQMKGYWLNHYFPQMLAKATQQMPHFKYINDELTNAGFKIANVEMYNIQDDLQDSFLYIGKDNPEIYFNDEIRAGISSFSTLADKGEIKQGLTNLRKDIQSGKFTSVKSRYENDIGDYLFIVAQKK